MYDSKEDATDFAEGDTAEADVGDAGPRCGDIIVSLRSGTIVGGAEL
jgi:hypothetical protein|tara:strand:+ start:397 stop:537 length:141 start_codon:yes stop_codon:yes gene_type:complete